jgi:hypothetical protein
MALALPAALAQPPTAAAAADVICNRYCDGRDPALATADRQPVTARIFGRAVALHVDDGAVMAWASIDAGSPGDEVWLDRSFDGGRNWTGRLGNASVPGGRSGWRGVMFNVDDWARHGVGAVRACGKAADRPDVACTAWARTTWNAADRRTAAATALMMFYDNNSGLFSGIGWWNSANALTAVIDDIRVSGVTSYTYAVANTYDRQRGAGRGDFRNDLLDDTGWWGLTWVRAYDLTGDARYLTTARADADHMASYWDGVCGGGVWWSTGRTYKNAITNSLYIQLNAALARRVPGGTTYRDRAVAGWRWFRGTGLINGAGLVNDGLDTASCRNNGAPTWTYNQGALMAALTELSVAAGDASALSAARALADAATTRGEINRDGILREPCEDNRDCGGDGPSFKGVFVRGLAALNAAAGGAYGAYLRRQADSAYARDRNSLDAYGLGWAGPLDSTDAARQQSATDLMNAAP